MTEPYRDPNLPVTERVEDLLGRMTVEEKAGQLTQFFFFAPQEVPDDLDVSTLPPEQQAYARGARVVSGRVSAGTVGSVLFVRDAALANGLQRRAVEDTRLGVPLLFGFDVIHGLRTIFPVPIATAASWDPSSAERGQAVAAREARAVGIHWAFAPMVDIARDARWGRIIEGAGEDPVLAAAMAAAQVRGFQGDLGPESILAGPKHFAGYGAARGGRDYDDSDISDSELRNVYLPPFKAAVDAGAANIMSAYMDLNGVPASGNRWLLTDVLRGEWGFEGFVVSDANAVKSLETQHFAADPADAGARALRAGLDMEMAVSDPAFTHLPGAVAEGNLDEAALDQAVRRVLAAKFALGLFESPYVDVDAAPEILGRADHRDAARAAAERTMVLLSNDGTLPLDAAATPRIAVIGELAASRRDVLGPWIFDYDAAESVTLLDGIRARVGDAAVVDYAPGVGIPRRVFPSMFDRMESLLEETPDEHDDDAELARAVELAEASDVAIVVTGQRQNQIGEKSSVSTLDLPGRAVEQIEALAATGTPVVVVLMTGRPVDLRRVDGKVAAIVEAWYPGTRGGEAVASVLFGDVSPAGRLPFTWPRHVGQVPMVYNHYRTFAPQDQGERYWDEESTPLYPFGHGLSYAAFAYDNLRVDRDVVPVGGTVQVAVDVTNRSDRAADEVVQLYIHQRHGEATRPVRELKGFERVTIGAGETRAVEFDLGPDQLRYWSAASRSWVQDETVIDVYVGGDSTAPLATVVTVQG